VTISGSTLYGAIGTLLVFGVPTIVAGFVILKWKEVAP
jgi:hypothetical protein